jgi:hypothetical protein
MTVFEPRYRVVDVTPPDHPNCHEFIIEHFRDGVWRIAIHEAMVICFADRIKAELVAGKLEHDEDISEEMQRVPVRWWDRPGFEPSRPVLTRRAATRGRNDEG